jgi:hypothetical protein
VSRLETRGTNVNDLSDIIIRLDVSEPSPVDDAYLDETRGILPQAMESASVMAGFVASVRLHVVLERAYVDDIGLDDLG